MRQFEVVRAWSPTHQKGAVNLGGHFKGTPMRAAKKAASKLCRESKIKGRCALNIEIKEITSGSSGQHFIYHVVRKKLPSPAVVQHNNVEVSHKYIVTAHKYNGPLVVEAPPKKKKVNAPKKKPVPPPLKKVKKAPPKKKQTATLEPTDEFIVDYSDNEGDHIFDEQMIQPSQVIQQQKVILPKPPQQMVKPPQQMVKPPQQMVKPPQQMVKPPQQMVKPPEKNFFEKLFG